MTEETKQPALKDIEDGKAKELVAELDRVFDYHKPEGHIVRVHEYWRVLTKAMATDLMGLPATRERAMALTRLEEMSFWAQACIARNHDKISEDPLKVDDDSDGESPS